MASYLRKGVNSILGRYDSTSADDHDDASARSVDPSDRIPAPEDDDLVKKSNTKGSGVPVTILQLEPASSGPGQWVVIERNTTVTVDESDKGTAKSPLYDLVLGNCMTVTVRAGSPHYQFERRHPSAGKVVYFMFVTNVASDSDDKRTLGARFNDQAAWFHIQAELRDARFAAVYGCEPSDENKRKKMPANTLHILNDEDPSPAEEMDWEPAGEGTAGGVREIEALESDQAVSPAQKHRGSGAGSSSGGEHKLYPGAMQNTFLMSPGGGIDVFRNKSGGLDDPNVHINTPLTPKQMMLAGKEKEAFCLTPSSSVHENKGCGHISELSLEREGAVVTDWQAKLEDTDIPVEQIVSARKGDQTGDSKLFHFVHKSRIGTFDARTREGVVSGGSQFEDLTPNKHREYGKDARLSCIVSTGDGCFAVGDRHGGIGLYNDSDKRAKNRFPGFGSPITSIDATYDGRWILGTTDDCLLLIYTLVKGNPETGGSSKSESLFKKQHMIGKAATPRVLRLSAADRARCGYAPLQYGHFTLVTEGNSSQQQERHIVATCGNAYVVFNLDQVKQELAPATGKTSSTNCTVHFSNNAYSDVSLLHARYADREGNDAIVATTAEGDVATSRIKRTLWNT